MQLAIRAELPGAVLGQGGKGLKVALINCNQEALVRRNTELLLEPTLYFSLKSLVPLHLFGVQTHPKRLIIVFS